jgi:hypothetical protein
MEKFNVKSIDDKEIVLRSPDDLDKVFDIITKDNNFIAQFDDRKAKVIVSSLISSKVKSGDLIVRAEE